MLKKQLVPRKIMENDEAIGMGFFGANRINQVKISKNNPLDAQEELPQTLVPTDKPYF